MGVGGSKKKGGGGGGSSGGGGGGSSSTAVTTSSSGSGSAIAASSTGGSGSTTVAATASSGSRTGGGGSTSAATTSPSSGGDGKASGGKASGGKKGADDSNASKKKLKELFNKYKDPEDDRIGPTGIQTFCQDINLDPEDVLVLVLAWRLEAAEMGYFSQEEWNNLAKYNADSIDRIKSMIPDLRADLKDETKFKEIYRFAFTFSREGTAKTIDKQIAIGLLGLLMASRAPVHTKNFSEFLESSATSYKAINMDQWTNFYEFSTTINEDFSNYDEMAAWSVILDEFVNWAKANGKVSAA